MRLRVAILMLFAQATLLSAQADENVRWQSIGSTTDATWSIDMESMHQRSDGVTQLWARNAFKIPHRVTPIDRAPASYTLMHIELDCGERRYRVLEGIWYDAKQTVIGSAPHDDGVAWMYPPPSTIMEELVGLCKTPAMLDGSIYRLLTATVDTAKVRSSERVARCDSARAEPASSLCRRWKAAKDRPISDLPSYLRLVDSVDVALGFPPILPH